MEEHDGTASLDSASPFQNSAPNTRVYKMKESKARKRKEVEDSHGKGPRVRKPDTATTILMVSSFIWISARLFFMWIPKYYLPVFISFTAFYVVVPSLTFAVGTMI
jgi:hypothetical protein